VDHRNVLCHRISTLLLQPDFADVTLIVNGERFPAHKSVLAACSEYFRALLFCGMRESHEAEVVIGDVVSVDAFRSLLSYIYTARINLSDLSEELVLEVLGLAHKYGIEELEDAISLFLRFSLRIQNVCVIYDASLLYGLSGLIKDCCSFIDRNAPQVMADESFGNVSADALKEMIARDSFCAHEVDIFRAVVQWIRSKNYSDPQEILSCVRLPLISIPDLMNVVRPCDLMTPDMILDGIKAKFDTKDTDLKYRGLLMPEENVATVKHGARVLMGDLKLNHHLLDGESHSYDLEKGFTKHQIDDASGSGILIELGTQCIVNHIKLLLWDQDTRAYSYYIEVSMDQKDWVRIIDYTSYLCRSMQHLYFNARVVKYIRLVGTNNTVNRVFHVVSFVCMFTEKPFEVSPATGILIPKHNVATIDGAASVIEGVSRSRNALINGDWENYDWDTGYTCHQLGSGSIIIQLPQPYLIDSMKLLLWDVDSRLYSYYIEVSVDKENWVRVHDRSKQQCRSWQLIRFPMRAVVFVKIVGTHNTANEVFHCVHFECPASGNEPLIRDDSRLTENVPEQVPELQ
jgi:BTB/POZ domain-containing protein 9